MISSNNVFMRLIMGLMAVLTVASMTCNVKDIVDDEQEIELDYNPLSIIICLEVIDAATSEPIDDREVSLRIEGEHRDQVVDLTGDSKLDFNLTNGLAGLGFPNPLTPTPDSPLEIVFMASADGYLSTSSPFAADSVGEYSVVISMVAYDGLPEGVSGIQGPIGTTDGSGQTTTIITVSTPPETNSGATAQISIPQGTVLRDEAGNVLQGALSASLTYFNNESDEALTAFPGGFFVAVTEDQTGFPDEGVFITGGFAAISITDATGRQAATFDTEVTLSIQMPGNTINPETDQPIQNGDAIDVWSYDQETGTWKFEFRGTASGPDGNGNFTVAFQSTHLSWWNLDWKWRLGICRRGSRVIFMGKESGAYLRLDLRRRRDNRILSRRRTRDNWIQFWNKVPRNLPVILNAYDRRRNLVGSINIDNLCDPGPFFMQLGMPTGVRMNFYVRAYAANRPQLYIRPSFPIWYREIGSRRRWTYGGVARNGRISIAGLLTPATYQFATRFARRLYTAVCEIRSDLSVFVPAQSTVYNGRIDGNNIYFDIEIPQDIINAIQ